MKAVNTQLTDEMMKLKQYEVPEIPHGLKKLTCYNDYTFTDRHYYIDLDNNCIYRYYPVRNICTKHAFGKKKDVTVIADNDKRVVIYNGSKLSKHMNDEVEFWSKSKSQSLKRAWK